MSDSLQELTTRIRIFCEARDWDQFHGAKDLAIGVITEAAELLEHFRFLDDAQIQSLLDNPATRQGIEEELADVLFFLLRFSQRFDIDLGQALVSKLHVSAKKYPVEKAKSCNLKYTKL